MNRTVRILLILVLIAGAAWYFVSRQGWTTIRRELRDFAIKDTAAITKFFFADRKGGRALLEQGSNGEWVLNGKYPADREKVNVVLATMHDVQVRNPVADNEFNQVIAFLASDGVKAEFYAGDQLVKTIYVGPSTPDQTGTFMLIDGSSTPFVTHIPGFVGYLSPRFITDELKWRGKEVFDEDAKNIRSVKVEYPGKPEESFTIENGMEPTIYSGDHARKAADVKYLRYYLGSFKGLYFEGFEENITPDRRDSVRNSEPFSVITLIRANGETTRLQIHLKPVDRRTKQQADEKGVKLPYDTDKYFAFLDQNPELLVIQDFSFNKVIKTLSDLVARRR